MVTRYHRRSNSSKSLFFRIEQTIKVVFVQVFAQLHCNLDLIIYNTFIINNFYIIDIFLALLCLVNSSILALYIIFINKIYNINYLKNYKFKFRFTIIKSSEDINYINKLDLIIIFFFYLTILFLLLQ